MITNRLGLILLAVFVSTQVACVAAQSVDPEPSIWEIAGEWEIGQVVAEPRIADSLDPSASVVGRKIVVGSMSGDDRDGASVIRISTMRGELFLLDFGLALRPSAWANILVIVVDLSPVPTVPGTVSVVLIAGEQPMVLVNGVLARLDRVATP